VKVEASIERYLAALDRADREVSDVPQARVDQIREKIAGLRGQMRFLKEMAAQVEAAPDHQVSLTDPDARSITAVVAALELSATTCRQQWMLNTTSLSRMRWSTRAMTGRNSRRWAGKRKRPSTQPKSPFWQIAAI
jgi:hypothetical protein